MTKKEKEIFDLAVDIDYAPLTVELSLEDRKALANSLLKLGYRNVSDLLDFIQEKQEAAESLNKEDPKHQNSYLGYYIALDLIKRWIEGEEQ